MNRNLDLSKHSALLTFVAGGLAGVAAALLFAPQSGARSRGTLRRQLREGMERGREARARVGAKVRNALAGIEERKESVAAAVEARRQAYRDKPAGS
jgi:gas vesicle protein